jgi:transposase-like protein
MGGAKDRAVRKMFQQGESNRSMARRLGITEGTIRYTLKRLGLERPKPESQTLEFEEETSECNENTAAAVEAESRDSAKADSDAASEVSSDDAVDPGSPAVDRVEHETECWDGSVMTETAAAEKGPDAVLFSLDDDPTDRQCDRALARLGLLQDAAPMFAPGKGIPGAGVLLAVPLIVSSGVLGVFEQLYRSLGPAFYGLRNVVMTLTFMALRRIKRAESLKEHRPADLGRVLGLDRTPEVKTLRRKLSILAMIDKGVELMRELGRKRLKGRKHLVGFLYMDGHVREYHGKGKLAKAYVTRRRLAAPGTTDTWVNDAAGDPVFLVTSEVNASLTQVLEPIVDEVEAIAGKGRRITFIFDRGGWSPKLFARLKARNVDVITYRKGKSDPLPSDYFQQVTGRVEGRKVTYKLHEMSVRMGKTKVRTPQGDLVDFWMREVTVLRSDGEHQTRVLTTRQDLTAVEVLRRMFNRWRQENFFKYMRQEYAIDGLVEYTIEPMSPDVTKPNPDRKVIEKKLRVAKSELAKMEKEYGSAAIENKEAARPTMRGFKIANGKLGKDIQAARKRIEKLNTQRKALPKRVPATDLERTSESCKMVTDAIKMTAYQIESDLIRLIANDYPRVDQEGHKLVVSALQSPADIDILDGELHVTLAAQSSPHRTRVVSKLCERLNREKAVFPGTNLRLRYGISET